MKYYPSLRFISLLLILLVSACQTPKEIDQPAPVVEAIRPLTVEQQQRLIDDAISLLEKGYYLVAKTQIEQVLSSNPSHSTGLFLYKQLTETPAQLFQTETFDDYQVQPGDSLGAIAKRFLGNSLYFVILARHNKLEAPSRLAPGTILAIPASAYSEKIKQDKRNSSNNLGLLKKDLAQQAYFQGLSRSIKLTFIPSDTSAASELQNQLLIAYENSLSSLESRQFFIENLALLFAKSRHQPEQQRFRTAITRQQHILKFYDAQQELDQANYQVAAEKLLEAKQEPWVLAHDDLAAIENTVNNRLHEEAVKHYNRQELKAALALWQLILKLQPTHPLALSYQNKTEKLLRKLDQF